MTQQSKVNYSKLLQHVRKRKSSKSLCESEVEGVLEDVRILWSN